MRKAEKFIKTVAIEVEVPSWAAGDNEVYAPRFLDEIADEIDTLENKKDTLFCEWNFPSTHQRENTTAFDGILFQ